MLTNKTTPRVLISVLQCTYSTQQAKFVGISWKKMTALKPVRQQQTFFVVTIIPLTYISPDTTKFGRQAFSSASPLAPNMERYTTSHQILTIIR